MKPLLLDILACPICKYYPLKLDIYKWETSEGKFTKIKEAFREKKLESLKNATKIRRGKDRIDDGIIITPNKEVLMKDEMVRKKVNIKAYFEEVVTKFENFTVMKDHTDEVYSSCLTLIKEEIIKSVNDTKAEVSTKDLNNLPLETQKKIINDILPEIYLLNWFFQFTEIEEGIIFCEKCNRWYPIIETIPQMLPDDLREESETDFLKKWESNLSNEIKEKGKPFNLKTK